STQRSAKPTATPKPGPKAAIGVICATALVALHHLRPCWSSSASALCRLYLHRGISASACSMPSRSLPFFGCQLVRGEKSALGRYRTPRASYSGKLYKSLRSDLIWFHAVSTPL